MAGHIQDRWFRVEKGPDGKTVKVKTPRHGFGMRYRARYIGPDGTEKSKSFPDRQKREADAWLARTRADMERGQYIDPAATRTTFQQYATAWLASHTSDPNTRIAMEIRLRLHVFPRIGSRPLSSFRPSHIRELVHALETSEIEGGYARTIYSNVRACLSAAVDDGYLPRNPCSAKSVKPPAVENSRVVPWTPNQVAAVRAALPERYRAMVDLGAGCGLRQGEILGLGQDVIDFESNTVRVVRQLKLINGRAMLAPPKGDKERDVPLPSSVASALQEHMKRHRPVPITLPWRRWGGEAVRVPLLFTNTRGGIVWRGNFNAHVWKPALATAGVIPEATPDGSYVSAREHGMHALRHFYASVLLDAGESIKAVSEYLGHSDPAMTLRVYAHLMPSSRERTRRVIDRTLRNAQ
ncbi:hypothetical protein GCM10027160_43830 [Streptomyces calidiresistens]|uniref:Tyrosine-type recombinase/integrase n=1 Tax=Streptomyces calidiresistens TaxID=1485586 RepID=A0A7W3XWS1_9ACTN|nr:site-specific integrase [Streptomyces calidiresistens]MBB0230375.1 tyrosine-type recombinase/integrase [Streptomyces calidiresistens]